MPALYTDGEAHTTHGSTQWLIDLVVVLVGAGLPVSWCRWILLRHRRQPGSVPRPPWTRAT